MSKKRKAAGPFQDLYRQSACQANQLAKDIYSSVNSQKSKELLTQLDAGRYSEIVSASINPMDYSNADTFSQDYLCVELMSKFPHWEIGIDRAGVALRNFSEIEERLALVTFTENPTIVACNKQATIRAIESTARTKIARILGEFDWNECSNSFAFGPGASTSLSRRRSDAAYKFGAQRPHMSYNAEIVVGALSRAHPTWDFTAQVVAGSRLVTVPKNAKTDRSICIEPDLNMYIQKGIGRMMRRRLQRWGLLLPHAQQINADYARIGSANGRLATVDLSSASDSIHLELCRLLLPSCWLSALEQARSPCTVLPSGYVHLLRKVSSMGNGFTFELETLIFYSLCQAVIDHFSSTDTDRQCTVFGDDIIIATELVKPLEEVLAYFGFSMNTKKTFSSGPFRESCGKHYFSGIDVTPFYVRDRIDSVHRKYWAANSVKRFSKLHWGLNSQYKPAYDRLVESIPPFFRKFLIPEGVGDVGLVSDWDEVCPKRDKENGWDAWLYDAVVPRFDEVPLEGQGLLLKVLHQLEFSDDTRNHYPSLRDMLRRRPGISLESLQAINALLNAQWPWSDDFPSGESESSLTDLPKPTGYRKKKNLKIHQWPSNGPWL